MRCLSIFFIGLTLIFVGCDRKQKEVVLKPNATKEDSLNLTMHTNNLIDSLFTGPEDNNIEISCTIPPEIMPVFPGGGEGLANFLKKNIRYPKTSADAQGVVYVSFMIREDGSTADVQVTKGIHEDFDAEAVR